jgi:hypothetical protein
LDISPYHGDIFPTLWGICKLSGATGGKSAFLATNEQGVRGNSHMMMMDSNNLQVADWILAWIEKDVPRKSVAPSKR